MTAVDLSRATRVHVVGVGGVGMSAIALLLVGMGHRVSGSDPADIPVLGQLREMGVDAWAGFEPERIPGDTDLVARSTAYGDDHPDVVEARRRGLPVLSRADILTALCATRPTLAVAGTHGKTTTSAWLAVTLRTAGLDPSFLVGGQLPGIGVGAAWGAGDWFVVEADESDGTFLRLGATGVIVTSVEPDHLEHYGGEEPMREAFARFLADAPGPRVVCADDPGVRDMVARAGVAVDGYGRSPDARWRYDRTALTGGRQRLSLWRDGEHLLDAVLNLPGPHNAANAAGAAVAALATGAPVDGVAAGLEAFVGVRRRFEVRGRAAGVTLVDDYAHLPGEVLPTVTAAREGGFDRVVCVFQPHRYSRTEQVGATFGGAFEGVDLLAVTELYTGGEAPRPGISGRIVFDAVDSGRGRPPTLVWTPTLADAEAWLLDVLRPGDLCLTLGAGDLTLVPDRVLAGLERR